MGMTPEAHDSRVEAAPVGQTPLDVVFAAAYDELRRLARAIRRSDPGATIDPTALVNEAWLKLSAAPGFASASPLHFRGSPDARCGKCSSRLPAAATRASAAARSGHGHARRRLDGVRAERRPRAQRRARGAREHQPRQAAMIKRLLRGLSVAETAESLACRSHRDDWRVARAG
jgi:DNA-directed RNA polymerase specialized sigma24 family protein